MNNLTHPTYIKARDLILKSEGRTIEDELGFGCYVDLFDHRVILPILKIIKSKNKYVPHSITFEHGTITPCSANDYNQFNGKHEMGGWFNLGRPISLDRVLMTLGKIEYEEEFFDTITCLLLRDSLLVQLEHCDYYASSRYKELFNWDYGKPLHLQSEKVWEKIVEILKG